MSAFLMVKGLQVQLIMIHYKDVITRWYETLSLKRTCYFSTRVSLFEGGLFQNDKYLYTMDTKAVITLPLFWILLQENIGQKLPRQYYRADAQLKWIHKNRGTTDFRAEYWQGYSNCK